MKNCGAVDAACGKRHKFNNFTRIFNIKLFFNDILTLKLFEIILKTVYLLLKE